MHKQYFQNLEELERSKSQMRMNEAEQRAGHAERQAIVQAAIKAQQQDASHSQAQEAGRDQVQNTQSLFKMLSETGGSAQAGVSRVTLPVKKRVEEDGGTDERPDNASRKDAFEAERVIGVQNLDNVDTNAEPAAITQAIPAMKPLSGGYTGRPLAASTIKRKIKGAVPKQPAAPQTAEEPAVPVTRTRKAAPSVVEPDISTVGEATGREVRLLGDALDPIASAKRRDAAYLADKITTGEIGNSASRYEQAMAAAKANVASRKPKTNNPKKNIVNEEA
jgi:hypothetical protein